MSVDLFSLSRYCAIDHERRIKDKAAPVPKSPLVPGGPRQVLELHFLKSGLFDLREEEEVIIKVFDDGTV